MFHEIGRCHLELENFKESRSFGERSIVAAQEAQDDMWLLNATVLVAQAEVRLKDYEKALESFETALEMAKSQGTHIIGRYNVPELISQKYLHETGVAHHELIL